MNNVYRLVDFRNRWNFIAERLREQNIDVLTISSDSDPKYNSAMRKLSLLGLKSTIFPYEWFQSGVRLDSDQQTFYVQDTPHVGTKMRNAFLQTDHHKEKYPFGDKYYIRVDHVKFVINNVPKDQHELTPTVLNSADRQNYDSVLKMCDKRVTNLMKTHVPESNGLL